MRRADDAAAMSGSVKVHRSFLVDRTASPGMIVPATAAAPDFRQRPRNPAHQRAPPLPTDHRKASDRDTVAQPQRRGHIGAGVQLAISTDHTAGAIKTKSPSVTSWLTCAWGAHDLYAFPDLAPRRRPRRTGRAPHRRRSSRSAPPRQRDRPRWSNAPAERPSPSMRATRAGIWPAQCNGARNARRYEGPRPILETAEHLPPSNDVPARAHRRDSRRIRASPARRDAGNALR